MAILNLSAVGCLPSGFKSNLCANTRMGSIVFQADGLKDYVINGVMATEFMDKVDVLAVEFPDVSWDVIHASVLLPDVESWQYVSGNC